MNQDNRNLVLAIVCSALLVIGYQIFYELPKQQALEEQALLEQKDLILTAPEQTSNNEKIAETSIQQTEIVNAPRITIDTPSIPENIAGWWFEIANDVFGALNSQKMWVILRGDEMICYESNFENSIVGILKLKDIASVEETEYTGTEIAMKGVKIHFKDSNVPSRTWCFGEDNLETRGMWIHALRKHCRSP